MKRAGAILAGTATLLLASFLLASAHPFGNAHLGVPGGAAPLEHTTVPPEVRAALVNKCADCHSMQTRSPFYARFAPVSWLVERDVVEGRERMNLSQWAHYSPEQQAVLKAKIIQQARARTMPLLQYRLIHWTARITDADVIAFTRWERMGAADEPASATSAEGDFLRGKEVFEKRCSGCHAIDQNREGPHLRGVFGRTSGTAAGFSYSSALRQAHIVWDQAWLEKWLTDTDEAVPGNNMDFHVPKAQEREDVITYLETLR